MLRFIFSFSLANNFCVIRLCCWLLLSICRTNDNKLSCCPPTIDGGVWLQRAHRVRVSFILFFFYFFFLSNFVVIYLFLDEQSINNKPFQVIRNLRIYLLINLWPRRCLNALLYSDSNSAVSSVEIPPSACVYATTIATLNITKSRKRHSHLPNQNNGIGLASLTLAHFFFLVPMFMYYYLIYLISSRFEIDSRITTFHHHSETIHRPNTHTHHNTCHGQN